MYAYRLTILSGRGSIESHLVTYPIYIMMANNCPIGFQRSLSPGAKVAIMSLFMLDDNLISPKCQRVCGAYTHPRYNKWMSHSW